jgi:hypothetical protein
VKVLGILEKGVLPKCCLKGLLKITIMRTWIKFYALILLPAVLFFEACKKEKEVTPDPSKCVPGNRVNITAQLIPFGAISIKRAGLTMASAGTKLLFAGGNDENGDESSRVDIYDTLTGRWTTAELSRTRWDVTAVTLR